MQAAMIFSIAVVISANLQRCDHLDALTFDAVYGYESVQRRCLVWSVGDVTFDCIGVAVSLLSITFFLLLSLYLNARQIHIHIHIFV